MRFGRLLFVVAVSLAGAGACHKKDDAAVQVVPGAPAGDVTEVSGDVHAMRDGKVRALAKGDAVSGDDVVKTGDDGRVTIVLRHNQVPWSLGPNKEKKVADSAAWVAAKGASGEVATDDKSGAAGRHAERSATDTAASSGGGSSGSGSAPGNGSGSAIAGDQKEQQEAENEAERQRAQAELAALQKEKVDAEERAAAEQAAAEHAERLKGVHISQECLDNPLARGCDGDGDSGGGKGSSDAHVTVQGNGDSDVRGALDPVIIRRVMQAHAHDFTRCYQQLVAKQPAAAGKIQLKMTIGTDGKVTKLDVTGDDALAPMLDCVRAAAAKLQFPKPDSPIQISYPLAFASAN